MGEKTKIQWCHHTFNAWIGCTKVSAECKFCYAEVETYPRVQRGTGRELWGEHADRHVTSDDNWKALRRWNRDAMAHDEMRRVFVNSMSDVAELPRRDDTRKLLNETRLRLWDEVEACTNLTFLLLTKRSENYQEVLPAHWLKEPRSNVWLGTTTGTQASANARCEKLLETPAVVHFVSAEPLLEHVDITPWLHESTCAMQSHPKDEVCTCSTPYEARINWVISGGESGNHARPHEYEWSRSLLKQTHIARQAFFMKQGGSLPMVDGQLVQLRHKKGGELNELPRDLRVREFPKVAA